MNLGDKIINLRKKSAMTQEELATKLNVSRQTISKWELSQSTPELNHISRLSEIFDVTTDYLIKETVTEIPASGDSGDNPNTISNLPVETKSGITLRQIIGIIITFLGGIFIVICIKLCAENPDWILGIWAGVLFFVIGLETVIVKKHLLLKIFWSIWCIIALPNYFLLTNISGNPFNLLTTGGIVSCLCLACFIVLFVITCIKTGLVTKIMSRFKK